MNITVYIYSRPHLRDDSLEYELYMGRDVLRSIFDDMKMRPDVTSLSLSFPENCLNILEQRQLYPRLEKYCPNLKELTIKTHSVYIVQCTHAKDCRIVDKTDIVETFPPNLEEKLYYPMVGNYFDCKKMNVVTSNGITQI